MEAKRGLPPVGTFGNQAESGGTGPAAKQQGAEQNFAIAEELPDLRIVGYNFQRGPGGAAGQLQFSKI